MRNVAKTIFLLCLCGQLAAQSQAVVRVELLDAQKKLIQFGSGVVVADLGPSSKYAGWYDNHIATCSHVLKSDKPVDNIQIVYRSGEKVRYAAIVADDSENDIAILRAIGPSESKEVAALGLFKAGGQYQSDGWQTRGACRASIQNSGKSFFDGSCSVGDSGGAVFDRDGRLVGMIQGGWFWLEKKDGATWPIRTAGRELIEATLRRAK